MKPKKRPPGHRYYWADRVEYVPPPPVDPRDPESVEALKRAAAEESAEALRLQLEALSKR